MGNDRIDLRRIKLIRWECLNLHSGNNIDNVKCPNDKCLIMQNGLYLHICEKLNIDFLTAMDLVMEIENAEGELSEMERLESELHQKYESDLMGSDLNGQI